MLKKATIQNGAQRDTDTKIHLSNLLSIKTSKYIFLRQTFIFYKMLKYKYKDIVNKVRQTQKSFHIKPITLGKRIFATRTFNTLNVLCKV